jgi:hypothetical protein
MFLRATKTGAHPLNSRTDSFDSYIHTFGPWRELLLRTVQWSAYCLPEVHAAAAGEALHLFYSCRDRRSLYHIFDAERSRAHASGRVISQSHTRWTAARQHSFTAHAMINPTPRTQGDNYELSILVLEFERNWLQCSMEMEVRTQIDRDLVPLSWLIISVSWLEWCGLAVGPKEA